MLRKNKTVEVLNLMNCNITDIKKLSEGLKFNKGLRHLFLNNN